MEYNFVVSDTARLDISGVKSYIESKNSLAAEKFSVQIVKTLATIKLSPGIGRNAAERFDIETDYLFFPVRSYTYLVFYTFDGQTVTIHRMLDSRSDYLRILGFRQNDNHDCEDEE